MLNNVYFVQLIKIFFFLLQNSIEINDKTEESSLDKCIDQVEDIRDKSFETSEKLHAINNAVPKNKTAHAEYFSDRSSTPFLSSEESESEVNVVVKNSVLAIESDTDSRKKNKHEDEEKKEEEEEEEQQEKVKRRYPRKKRTKISDAKKKGENTTEKKVVGKKNYKIQVMQRLSKAVVKDSEIIEKVTRQTEMYEKLNSSVTDM